MSGRCNRSAYTGGSGSGSSGSSGSSRCGPDRCGPDKCKPDRCRPDKCGPSDRNCSPGDRNCADRSCADRSCPPGSGYCRPDFRCYAFGQDCSNVTRLGQVNGQDYCAVSTPSGVSWYGKCKDIPQVHTCSDSSQISGAFTTSGKVTSHQINIAEAYLKSSRYQAGSTTNSPPNTSGVLQGVEVLATGQIRCANGDIIGADGKIYKPDGTVSSPTFMWSSSPPSPESLPFVDGNGNLNLAKFKRRIEEFDQARSTRDMPKTLPDCTLYQKDFLREMGEVVGDYYYKLDYKQPGQKSKSGDVMLSALKETYNMYSERFYHADKDDRPLDPITARIIYKGMLKAQKSIQDLCQRKGYTMPKVSKRTEDN